MAGDGRPSHVRRIALLLGVATTRDPARLDRLRQTRAQLGATPGALEAFLALRGLRTLPVRLELAQATALTLATRLDQHPAVTAVYYPGLPGDAGHERARRLMDGFGAMLSFELHRGAGHADAVCERVAVITHAKSLGGVETLIERRARATGTSARCRFCASASAASTPRTSGATSSRL